MALEIIIIIIIIILASGITITYILTTAHFANHIF